RNSWKPEVWRNAAALCRDSRGGMDRRRKSRSGRRTSAVLQSDLRLRREPCVRSAWAPAPRFVTQLLRNHRARRWRGLYTTWNGVSAEWPWIHPRGLPPSVLRRWRRFAPESGHRRVLRVSIRVNAVKQHKRPLLRWPPQYLPNGLHRKPLHD